MYGKLFASMFRGSLYGKWHAIVTFQQMIILADQDGTVDYTPEALSATTSIPLDIIQQGISLLESPDPTSRTPDAEGRRIVRLDPERPWGWHIVNYAHYRAIRTAEERRAYHRDYWRKNRVTQPDSTKTQQSQPIAEVEANAEAGISDTPYKTETSARSRFVKPSVADVKAYCYERGNTVDPETFVSFYESNGWKVGRNPMKDWKAAVRTWEKNQRGTNGKDTRSRAKRVADRLDDIARRDVERNGFAENLD